MFWFDLSAPLPFPSLPPLSRSSVFSTVPGGGGYVVMSPPCTGGGTVASPSAFPSATSWAPPRQGFAGRARNGLLRGAAPRDTAAGWAHVTRAGVRPHGPVSSDSSLSWKQVTYYEAVTAPSRGHSSPPCEFPRGLSVSSAQTPEVLGLGSRPGQESGTGLEILGGGKPARVVNGPRSWLETEHGQGAWTGGWGGEDRREW